MDAKGVTNFGGETGGPPPSLYDAISRLPAAVSSLSLIPLRFTPRAPLSTSSPQPAHRSPRTLGSFSLPLMSPPPSTARPQYRRNKQRVCIRTHVARARTKSARRAIAGSERKEDEGKSTRGTEEGGKERGRVTMWRTRETAEKRLVWLIREGRRAREVVRSCEYRRGREGETDSASESLGVGRSTSVRVYSLVHRLCPLISRLMGRDVRTTDVCLSFMRDRQKRRARPVYLANTPNRKTHFFGRF